MGIALFAIIELLSFSFDHVQLDSTRTHSHRTGEPYQSGDVVSVFFAILMGATSIGQAGPSLHAFALGDSNLSLSFSFSLSPLTLILTQLPVQLEPLHIECMP